MNNKTKMITLIIITVFLIAIAIVAFIYKNNIQVILGIRTNDVQKVENLETKELEDDYVVDISKDLIKYLIVLNYPNPPYCGNLDFEYNENNLITINNLSYQKSQYKTLEDMKENLSAKISKDLVDAIISDYSFTNVTEPYLEKEGVLYCIVPATGGGYSFDYDAATYEVKSSTSDEMGVNIEVPAIVNYNEKINVKIEVTIEKDQNNNWIITHYQSTEE